MKFIIKDNKGQTYKIASFNVPDITELPLVEVTNAEEAARGQYKRVVGLQDEQIIVVGIVAESNQ